jgi:6-pyruvoyltetrahydropterin/6-carboxytetrahydropterin synthase
MHRVRKELQFCYGHRLLGYAGKCARLHGHNAVVEVTLASEALDERGMVCDFARLKGCMQEFLDGYLDHRTVLHENDPLASALQEAGQEPYLMKDNPTAENLAKLVFQWARGEGFPVEEVRLWETPTACAEYREGAHEE